MASPDDLPARTSAAADPRRPGAFGLAWIGGIVAFAAARSLAVAPTLGPYGIDPWVFFALDVGSAFPFGYGQLRILRGLRASDYAAVQRWSGVTTLAFLSPYAYALLGAQRPMPMVVYLVVVAFLALFGVATLLRMRHSLRSALTLEED